MTSKYKARTGSTPRLSSEESTEAKAAQSKPLAGMTTVEKSTPFMTITPPTSGNTLITGKSVSEKSKMAAQILKAVLSRLEKDGLIKRFRVLSPDRTTVKEIQVVFDNSIWDENLELRVLSENDR